MPDAGPGIKPVAGILGLDWQLEQERMAEETEGEDDIGARLMRAFETGA